MIFRYDRSSNETFAYVGENGEWKTSDGNETFPFYNNLQEKSLLFLKLKINSWNYNHNKKNYVQ